MNNKPLAPDHSPSYERRPVVLQIGPAPGSNGGIASVIEETLQFESNGFEQHACPSWTPSGKLASLPTALRAAATMSVQLHRWDIAHVHLSEYGSFLREGGLLLLARALRRPAVATLHGANLLQHVTKYPRLTRTVFDAASIVLCLGENQAEIVARVSPKASIRIVANPIDNAAFQPVTAPSHPRHERPKFVFAGEVGYRKGYDRLIKAWDTVLEAYPNAQLRIAGPVVPGYEVDSKNGVEYLGNLTRTALLEEFSSATATVLPSRAEVLPMVLIESHARGTPTIYTTVGEWEVFADAPEIRLIDAKNQDEDAIISSIAEAMIDLVAAPSLQRDLLVEWTRDRFSGRVVSDQLRNAYLDALCGSTFQRSSTPNQDSGHDMDGSRPTNSIGAQKNREES